MPMSDSTSRSRVSANHGSQRGVREDGIVAGSSNRMSKAVAWIWYTRSFANAAAALEPTMQPHPVVIASCNIDVSSSRQAGAASKQETDVRKVQPSRFRKQADTAPAADPLHSSPLGADALHGSAQASTLKDSAAVRDADLESNHTEERPPKVNTDLYDEYELFCLQELLQETEIDHRHSKLSAQPSRQIKFLSAIRKLFRKLSTTVRDNPRNSAIETGPSSRFGARKLGSAQHVVHHHHHHYHHYRSSLDLPRSEPAHDVQGSTRRRRLSDQSYSQAGRSFNSVADVHHLVADSL